MKMARTLVHNLMHLTGQIYARYEIRNPDSADRATSVVTHHADRCAAVTQGANKKPRAQRQRPVSVLLEVRWPITCTRLFDTASGPQLHGSLGSTGLRHMPPHYSLDLEHGPGAGSGLLPRLPTPACSRPVTGVGLGLFVVRVLYRGLPAPALPLFFALRSATVCQ
jgi:hypothetical protein